MFRDHTLMRGLIERRDAEPRHMHCTKTGHIVVARAHALPSKEHARRLAWTRRGTSEVPEPEEIFGEWERVRSAFVPTLGPTDYEALTRLELTQSVSKTLMRRTLEARMRDLRRVLPGFSAFPASAQEALLDLAYDLGVSGLERTLTRCVSLCRVHAWDGAARECRRPGAASRLNLWTRSKFEDAARSSRRDRSTPPIQGYFDLG